MNRRLSFFLLTSVFLSLLSCNDDNTLTAIEESSEALSSSSSMLSISSAIENSSSSPVSSSSVDESSSSSIIPVPVLVFLSSSSSITDTTPLDTLNSLLFDRIGGGQLHFYADVKNSTIRATVTSYNFNSANLKFAIPVPLCHLICVDTIVPERVLAGSIITALDSATDISGTFEPPTSETGTWLSIYVVSAGVQTEITDITLRSSLLSLETMIQDSCLTTK